jgi:hypothetical protein
VSETGTQVNFKAICVWNTYTGQVQSNLCLKQVHRSSSKQSVSETGTQVKFKAICVWNRYTGQVQSNLCLKQVHRSSSKQCVSETGTQVKFKANLKEKFDCNQTFRFLLFMNRYIYLLKYKRNWNLLSKSKYVNEIASGFSKILEIHYECLIPP